VSGGGRPATGPGRWYTMSADDAQSDSAVVGALARFRGLIGVIRDMSWLDAERSRFYGVLLSIGWSALVGLIVVCMRRGLDSQGHLFGGDFASFWAGSRLVLTGRAADVYVPAVHYAAQRLAGTVDFESFYYPPPYLLVCAPLALLSFFPSLIIFQALTGTAYCVTLGSILRTRWRSRRPSPRPPPPST
jgi:hypothetical protein